MDFLRRAFQMEEIHVRPRVQSRHGVFGEITVS